MKKQKPCKNVVVVFLEYVSTKSWTGVDPTCSKSERLLRIYSTNIIKGHNSEEEKNHKC